MKILKVGITLVTLICFQLTQGQEKKIKFSKGTLKICSSKNFQIKGYDGNEVIIKSLHEKKDYGLRGRVSTSRNNIVFPETATVTSTDRSRTVTRSRSKDGYVYVFGDDDRKKGLKKLGKKSENKEYGIYFTIEEKDGELIFKDNEPERGRFVMFGDESYEIQIPNSLKLSWRTNGCYASLNRRSTFFYNSNPSSLSDFNGEVEIESSLSNIKLIDVTGPVSMNTIGGNVTVEFKNKTPQKLYSIYSNNGFIDFTLPEKSQITLDANGKAIYSDVDFNVLEDTETRDSHKMRLKLGNGKVKMKLDAGLGNIYLRKK